MSKKDDTNSTATRVKAFRDRLASSSYKRVEGYITAEEKVRIDAVKTQLGVTTDIAVAGLLRMGLEQFEKTALTAPLTTPGTPVTAVPSVSAQPVYTQDMETCIPGELLETKGFAMMASAAVPQSFVSTELMSLTNSGVASSMSALSMSANACAFNATPVGLNAVYGVGAEQDNDNNPISRFFKSRKEMNSNE